LTTCFFVSDLHGHIDRYRKLFEVIADEHPAVLFIGGDILPSGAAYVSSIDPAHSDFVNGYLAVEFEKLKKKLGQDYPKVFLILGNDDARITEASILEVATRGLWEYIPNRKVSFELFTVYGYAHVPPTPFLLKDWERYDVSRYVDPGCISPEEGSRTIPVSDYEKRYTTIQKDLDQLVGNDALENAVFLFHTPPYETKLDRAALDGKTIDYAPLDPHIGSIAVRRFIESRQPLITLHGHVHESARLTGSWRDRIGNTHLFSAAHDGTELSLVRFELEKPDDATRELL